LAAAASKMGAKARQGPHHDAQQSTSTVPYSIKAVKLSISSVLMVAS
jgi:hypothetical protein